MKSRKAQKQSIATTEHHDRIKTLDKLEGGLKIKLGDKEINDLYRQKLSESLNVDEPITTTIKGVKKPSTKPPKVKKEPSERGKKASEYLSKYRQQVREALELKKKIENKNTLIYEDESDADEEDEEDDKIPDHIPQQPTQPIAQAPAPVVMPDMSKVYSEIDTLKKQNKALEERLLFRRDVLGISDMRKNMLIKF